VTTPILDLRIYVLNAICRAQRLPESAERTLTLDYLRAAARTLLPLVQAEEDEAMREHLRARDTLPAPSPESERTDRVCLPPPAPEGAGLRPTPLPGDELADVATHWSLTHE
jgi:hypothetical protein